MFSSIGIERSPQPRARHDMLDLKRKTMISDQFLISDLGSLPEIRIWSISLIKSDLKLCIHLGRIFFILVAMAQSAQGRFLGGT